MRGTQTIWRAGFAAAVTCFALCCGCESSRLKPKRSQESALEQLQLAEPEAAASAPPLAPAVAQALRDLHEQRLEILPPNAPAQRLDFGTSGLLQASGDQVVLRDAIEGEVLAKASIGSVLAVAHGADGALFALGIRGGTRFEARSKSAQPFPHATFFPGSTLFPDLEQPAQFYVYHPLEQQLLRYPFQSEVGAGAFLSIDASIPFVGCTGTPTQLRDGALACRTATGFARKAPRGQRTEFKSSGDFGQAFRLLPGKRLDELFSVDRDGSVKHVRLAPGVPVLGTFQLPSLPYAAAANTEALAFVLMSAPEPGKERRWTLLVSDFDGQPRLQAELGAKSAAADEDWAQAVIEDKNLAISAFEPLVAVGGAARVRVWDYRQGHERFNR